MWERYGYGYLSKFKETVGDALEGLYIEQKDKQWSVNAYFVDESTRWLFDVRTKRDAQYVASMMKERIADA